MTRKRALLIGINYQGTRNELSGCLNDVDNIKTILLKEGYREQDIIVMKDDGSGPTKLHPNRKNILMQMKTFARLSKSGDRCFFHYSGHGTYTYDRNGDEVDGVDEAICPAGGSVITDDEIRAYLINRLPYKCSLFMLMDCCHSGTGADLRFNYEDISIHKGSIGRKRFKLPDNFVFDDWVPKSTSRENQRVRETKCTVICISGCRDQQTSADTVFDNQACGAMTAVFKDCWEKYSNAGIADLRNVLLSMSCMLRCYRYGQRPQLSLGSRDSATLFNNGKASIIL